MAMHFHGSPGNITAEETTLKDTDTPITIVIDKFNYVFLTLEQARSLWHELGAVLQSLDHDTGVEAPAEATTAPRSTGEYASAECANCLRPISFWPNAAHWVHSIDKLVNCVGSTDEQPRVATPVMAISKSDSIRNLEDLRGLPHSFDLESHPSNSRR